MTQPQYLRECLICSKRFTCTDPQKPVPKHGGHFQGLTCLGSDTLGIDEGQVLGIGGT